MITSYEQGYRDGLEAAAKIAESAEKPGDAVDVALRLQLTALRIRSLGDKKPSVDFIRCLEWAARQP